MSKQKIMNEAIRLAMKINGGTEARCGHGHPTAFIRYGGHVNVLEIEIHEIGWVPNSDPDKRYEFCFYRDEGMLLGKLERLREYAKELTKRRRGNKNDK